MDWKHKISAIRPLFTNATLTKTIDVTKPIGATSAATNGTINASYNIPIYAPTGTNGIVPSIALNYTLGLSNSVVGVVYNLMGLSVITLIPKNYYCGNEQQYSLLPTRSKIV